jgi:hypothetical protein
MRTTRIAGDGERDAQIGGRQMAASLVRPLDQTDTADRAGLPEIFVQTCFNEFIRIREAIKIKVIQREV